MDFREYVRYKLDYATDVVGIALLNLVPNIEAVDTYAHAIGSVILAVGAGVKVGFDIYVRYKQIKSKRRGNS